METEFPRSRIFPPSRMHRGPLRFSVTVEDRVVVGCEVVGVGLVDLGP